MKKINKDAYSGVATHPHQSKRHKAKILNDLDFTTYIVSPRS